MYIWSPKKYPLYTYIFTSTISTTHTHTYTHTHTHTVIIFWSTMETNCNLNLPVIFFCPDRRYSSSLSKITLQWAHYLCKVKILSYNQATGTIHTKQLWIKLSELNSLWAELNLYGVIMVLLWVRMWWIMSFFQWGKGGSGSVLWGLRAHGSR